MIARALRGALVLALVGCGAAPATTPRPAATPRPPLTAPSAAPASLPALPVIQRDVMLAYQDLATLRASYVNEQAKGSEQYRATVAMRFAKPRRVRLDVKECTDSLVAGAAIQWTGGSTVKGKKQIGPITINQEHTLAEKPSLRGWTFDQTDYHAMVQALTVGMNQGRLTGWQVVGGRNLLMVEFPSTLRGAQRERVGLDPALRLPVYREIYEAGQARPIFVTRYHDLQLNAELGKDAFTL